MKFLEEEVEEARTAFPRVMEEFDRIRLWVLTCLGEHVALPGGPTVEAPEADHQTAAEALKSKV